MIYSTPKLTQSMYNDQMGLSEQNSFLKCLTIIMVTVISTHNLQVTGMNLMDFLRKVDDRLNSMTYEELRQYVHETARTLGEWERERFLSSLSSAGSNTNKTSTDAVGIYSDTVSKYKAEAAQILQKLDDLDINLLKRWKTWKFT